MLLDWDLDRPDSPSAPGGEEADRQLLSDWEYNQWWLKMLYSDISLKNIFDLTVFALQ